MKRVIVDQDIAPIETVRAGLPDSWDVSVGIPAEPARLTEALAGIEYLIVTSRVAVTEDVLEHANALEIIGKLGTGTDNIDLEAAAKVGVPVTYTPGYNALSVAEHTLGLILATARRYTNARRLMESGRWRDEMPLGTRVSGSTVGIIGLGNVGKRLGKLLLGFDVEILYCDPYVPSIDGELVNADPVRFEELLERSDIVCLTPELTAETSGMIDEEALARMPDTSLLINTARGDVVDQEALIAALKGGAIAGAGLDVFATEPLPADSPLLSFDEVVVTPHVGGMTAADRDKTISHLTRNMRALARGDEIDEEFLATPATSPP